jgi:hypothetical protein
MGPREPLHVGHRLQRGPEPAPATAPCAVGDGQLLPCSQPEHPLEVMTVVGSERRRFEVVDERVRRGQRLT